MELFTAIVGLVMIYAWVHSIVIIAKKIQDITSYETVVLIAGATGVGLYILGTI